MFLCLCEPGQRVRQVGDEVLLLCQRKLQVLASVRVWCGWSHCVGSGTTLGMCQVFIILGVIQDNVQCVRVHVRHI